MTSTIQRPVCWMETHNKPHFDLGMKRVVVIPA